MKKLIPIPIYEARLWLIISDQWEKYEDHVKERHNSTVKNSENFSGLLCYGATRDFSLFIRKSEANEGVIVHEIFHATHRILDFFNCNFDSDHHEQGALLYEFIYGKVMAQWRKSVKSK